MTRIRIAPTLTRIALLVAALCALPAAWAAAQGAAPMQISWEVRNRSRLLREERDFHLDVDSPRNRRVTAPDQPLDVPRDDQAWGERK